jgi:hypothetical protein
MFFLIMMTGFLIHKKYTNCSVKYVLHLRLWKISFFLRVRPIFLDDAILITIRRKNEGRCFTAGHFSCPLYCTVYIRSKVYLHHTYIHTQSMACQLLLPASKHKQCVLDRQVFLWINNYKVELQACHSFKAVKDRLQ